jgi:hypothetical protein
MNLVVLYEPPAVGKLTIARSLSTVTGYAVLHNHLTFDLVRTVYAPEDERFFPLNAELRLRIVREGAECRCPGLILTCVLAANSRNDIAFVRDVMDVVTSRAGHAHFVRLCCDVAELVHRVTGPDRLAAGKQAGVEVLRTYLQRWDVLGTIPGLPSFVLDTTHLQPDDAAHQIARHFGLAG